MCLVMCDRVDQVLDFSDSAVPNGSLAAPGAPFRRLLAAGFDEAMAPTEWSVFADPSACSQRCTNGTWKSGARTSCRDSRPGMGRWSRGCRSSSSVSVAGSGGLRISAIVDAEIRLIVDGVSA